jgi:NAD(P)-dependent dehydrogenase (short-subunit alcohol dehydrogenase family)
MGKLDGKVAIITGTSYGLGRQTAIRFAEEGARLAICARNELMLEETRQLCKDRGADVLAVSVDVTEYDELSDFVEKTVECFGTVDILINNAMTINAPQPFLEQDIDTLEESLHSGLYSTWNLMQLCFPYLERQGGAIVNFGSVGGVKGMEGFASYAAAKEAIRGLSRVAAREWGKYGIRVNVLCPNVVTDRFEQGIEMLDDETRAYLKASMSENAMCRPGYAYEDATPAIVFLASDDSRWVTGQTLHVEGGVWIGP